LTELRLYFDENVEPEIVTQLVRKGIDAVGEHDLNLTGDSDENHLQRATEMNRVLCTYDQDFFYLNNAGIEHAGIFFATHARSTIGGWVRQITKLHAQLTMEEVRGQLTFIDAR
jgi:hypothetical protein